MLHSDLLDQARHLARREPNRPKQASLRRSISSAYYAVFHLLTYDASRLFVKDERLAARVNRLFGHAEMAAVSKDFASDIWPKIFDPAKRIFRIPQELKEVAQAFVDLQQARHDADYDLTRRFTRAEAEVRIGTAELAFERWERIRKEDLARVYLACFLLKKEWDRPR